MKPARRLRVGALGLGLLFCLPGRAVQAIEVRKGGHFSKVFVSRLNTREFFDAGGRQRVFDFESESRLRQFLLEYRYGVTGRWNVGIRLPVLTNAFENRFEQLERSAATDLTVISEYRLLTLPWILAVRGEVQQALGYRTSDRPWVGNGTTEFLAGVNVKRFFLEFPYARLWIDAEAVGRTVLRDDAGNLHGERSLSFRAAVNVRPSWALTLAPGVTGRTGESHFLAIEGFVKYRLAYVLELEVGLSKLASGSNSARGTALLIGVTVHTARLWE